MNTRKLRFPPKNILVPLDPTPASDPAWRTARWLGATFGARVQGLFVRESLIYAELPPAPYNPEAAFRELRQRLHAGEDELAMVPGDPGFTILNWGRNLDYDLVVMGTHGRTGLERVISGSVAEEVVRRSEIPVLVARKPLEKVRMILAPVNFEPYAAIGLAQAAEIAQVFGARLTVLHVVDAPVYGGAGALKAARHMLADVVNRLPAAARAATKPKTVLAVGKPAEQIANAARAADLVAIVAHRRSFLGDALLGTTAQRVLRLCQTPVLSLPAGAPAARENGRRAAPARARKASSVTLF